MFKLMVKGSVFALGFTMIFVNSVSASRTHDLQKLTSKMKSHSDQEMSVIIEYHQTSQQQSLGSRASASKYSSKANATLSRVKSKKRKKARHFQHMNMMSMELSADELENLKYDVNIKRVYENGFKKISNLDSFSSNPLLINSNNIIQSDQIWNLGVEGARNYIAILDTGLYRSHDMFRGKSIIEACFSSTTRISGFELTSTCPGGSSTRFGFGAAAPNRNFPGVHHGTHVAGIALGNSNNITYNNTRGLYGVSRASGLIAINVFSSLNDSTACGGSQRCIVALDSDVIGALDYVYSIKDRYNVVAANLSLGSGAFASSCDSTSSYTTVANRFRSSDIPIFAASGNGGQSNGISDPACVSSIISVGSVDRSGATVSGFSNGGAHLDLLAPGSSIASADIDFSTDVAVLSGTSMASPHAAGGFSLLKEAFPSFNLSQILQAMKNTGAIKFQSGRGKPLIQLNNAYNRLLQDSGGNNSNPDPDTGVNVDEEPEPELDPEELERRREAAKNFIIFLLPAILE